MQYKCTPLPQNSPPHPTIILAIRYRSVMVEWKTVVCTRRTKEWWRAPWVSLVQNLNWWKSCQLGGTEGYQCFVKASTWSEFRFKSHTSSIYKLACWQHMHSKNVHYTAVDPPVHRYTIVTYKSVYGREFFSPPFLWHISCQVHQSKSWERSHQRVLCSHVSEKSKQPHDSYSVTIPLV